MINLLTANLRNNSKRYHFEALDTLLKAQIENSLDLGWNIDKIVLVSNFEYRFAGVSSVVVDLTDSCLTGSKMFALQWLIDKSWLVDELGKTVIWAHDLDAWQNVPFGSPDFKDVGISTYSSSKLNGGSVFWRLTAIDIVQDIVETIEKGETKEEPTLNKLLKSRYKDRTTILNTTYNVGCSGFFPRIYRAEKPVKVCHLNPTNRIAWETHVLDRNGMGMVSVHPRLELLLRKYYPHLATTLSEEGKKRSVELRKENIRKLKL